jgi:outer membrane protein with beta-barrel domain
MTSKLLVRSALILFVVTAFAATLSAQKMEIYPNAGFIWPRHFDNGQNFKDEGIYGLKGGVFLNQNFQLEGSFGYLNHFEMRQPPNPFNPAFGITQPTIRGYLYDFNTVYNFGERQFLHARVAPFVVAGGGGLTTAIKNADVAFIEGGGNVITPSGLVVPNPGRSKTLESGDTFFTVNYGAGVKFLNVAGPMGFRVDLRGRTLPNFLGETTTWLEPTAGITFSWGER